MLHEQLSSRIIACGITVHRALGPGLPQSFYQAALSIELTHQGIPYYREPPITALYRDHDIGAIRADFLVSELIVTECKAVTVLSASDHRQFKNFLRLSPYEVGLIVNFGTPVLGITRKDSPNSVKNDPASAEPGTEEGHEEYWLLTSHKGAKKTAS